MSDTPAYLHAIIYVGIFGIVAVSLGIYRLSSLTPGDKPFVIALSIVLITFGAFFILLFLNGIRTRRKRRNIRIKEERTNK